MLCALNCVCEVHLPTYYHFNPQYKLLITVIYNIAITTVKSYTDHNDNIKRAKKNSTRWY